MSDSERLQAVISLLGFKSANAFAKSVGIPQSEASHIKMGQRPISASVAYKIHKYDNSIEIEWLVEGEGQMLKSKETTNENEPLGAGYYFPSNLSFLIEEVLKTNPDNLPSIIHGTQQIITELLDGSRRPSVALLIRLREALGVTIDALLLSDLSLPENMEHLKKGNAPPDEMDALKKTLETILQTVEEMKKAQERMETEVERLKDQKDAQPKGP